MNQYRLEQNSNNTMSFSFPMRGTSADPCHWLQKRLLETYNDYKQTHRNTNSSFFCFTQEENKQKRLKLNTKSRHSLIRRIWSKVFTQTCMQSYTCLQVRIRLKRTIAKIVTIGQAYIVKVSSKACPFGPADIISSYHNCVEDVSPQAC